MATERLRVARLLSIVLLLLMAIQAVLGLAFHSEYRDVAWIASTWWGNDAVTLFVGVPLLAWAIARAGVSNRALMSWTGLLAYEVYNNAYYLLGAALNRFFVLYVAGAIVSVAALIHLLSALDVAKVAQSFRSRTPVRLIGGYFVFTAVGLSVIWLATWAAYAFAGRPTPVEPEAFKLVAALDMTLMVPVLAAGGWQLWRRQAWGYVIAALAGVQASVYLLVLSVNSAVAIARGLVEAPGELTTWAPLFLATGAATVALLWNAEPRATNAEAGHISSK